MSLFAPGSWSRAVLQIAASAVTVWAGFTVFGSTHSFLFIWPLTAVQVSIALGDWSTSRSRAIQLFSAFAGHIIAGRVLGLPLWIGTWLAAVQILEVAAIIVVLSPNILKFEDLKRRTNVLRFCLVAFLVPLVSVAMVAKPISALTRASLFQSWLIAAPSDCLGIAAILPALLLLWSPESRDLRRFRPLLGRVLCSSSLLVLAALVIFLQDSKPLLFLVFPPLVVLLFVTGLEGAAFASLAVTAVAGWATVHGHGPIWLMHTRSPNAHILFLQIFLATIVAVSMPVGALLSELQEADRSAREGESISNILIQNAEDMIVLSTLDGTRRFVSPAVQSITGWTGNEYLALGPLGGIYPEDREFVSEIIDSLMEGEMRQSLRHRMLCKDGSSRWVETSFRGFTDSRSDRIVGFVATVRDASQQMENEEVWLAETAALATQNRQLSDLAMKDELTGVANRRAFNAIIEYEFERHARSANPLSLLMLDVDHFKRYNDTLGHPAGDVCLRRLAQTVESRVHRTNDRVARVGGEEFAVVLPETDENGARKVAQDILDTVSSLGMAHPGSPLGRVSVSIGLATVRPTKGDSSASLIQQVDQALYASKQSGRNRFSVSGDIRIATQVATPS